MRSTLVCAVRTPSAARSSAALQPGSKACTSAQVWMLSLFLFSSAAAAVAAVGEASSEEEEGGAAHILDSSLTLCTAAATALSSASRMRAQ